MPPKNCIGTELLKNAAPIMMALFVTAGFFYFVDKLTSPTEIPKDSMTQLNILLGGIAVVWAKCISFFYDSSASSKSKDESLQEIAKASTGTGNGVQAPINIPNADSVVVKNEKGDITVQPTQSKKGK